MVDVTREALEEVTNKIIDLVLRKNSDYGDAWQKHGVTGVLVRLSDKSLRLQNLEGKKQLIVDESWVDTLTDIAGYSILGLLLNSAESE